MYSTTGEGDKSSSSTSAHPCRFSIAEIRSATKDFDDELVIGQGGFGKVYKGHICSEETNLVVAIKRLDSMSNQGAPEFRAEIEMLSKLRHCHLVSLIGYCDDSEEMILVYQYMPHGTLYDHLHKAGTPLNWVQRLKIAIGAGRGLDYLHTGVGTQHGIIHRDVKSSNILLDVSWAAMISDFGLSKMGPTNRSSTYVDASIKGTFGYLDPDYFYTQKLTRKTDVFAFGVVLLELLSGRLAVDDRFGEEQCSLVKWAQKCVKERKFDQMVDTSIRGTIFPKCLRRFAQIANSCLHSSPKERPTMAQVVVELQSLLALQEKSDNSAGSPGIVGFTWKMSKYFCSSSKGNSEHRDTNSPKSSDHNMNQCSSTNKHDNNQHEMLRPCGEIDLKVFTYDELQIATRGALDHKFLDEGSYGNVYRGWVGKLTYSPCNRGVGLPIVIKRLHPYKYGSLEKFELDLKLLRKFNHPNVIKVIGYCLHGKELFLVYDYMHNGNLEDNLRSGAVERLPLVARVKMVVGIARGLVFLHKTQDQIFSSAPWPGKFSESRIQRRNILLDKDLTVKLSGYDVKMLIPSLVGGYDDFCYYTGCEPIQLLRDGASFTELFTEILTGKRILPDDNLHTRNRLLRKKGILKDGQSLGFLANHFMEICNDVDAESKMLSVLKKFGKYAPT